jgi:hypothetical protein
MRPEVVRWLASACADAEQRGLPELKPLLEGLARATDALRAADPDFAGPESPASSPDVADTTE